MLRPRIIPCLLIHQGGLVKTVEFKNPKYVGDPINAVKIFNEKEADELIVLDIDASVNGVQPNYEMIAHLAAECRMPLCYGGGVKTPEQAKKIISLGVEKIAVSSAVIEHVSLISRIAEAVGRQSVVAVLDLKKKKSMLSKGYEVFTHNATRASKLDPFKLVDELQLAGAGEIVINSIDRDGQMKGYDIELAIKMREILKIPMTFLGGAGALSDISAILNQCGVVGAAAGSLFVFKGPYKAVLINYPNPELKDSLAKAALKDL